MRKILFITSIFLLNCVSDEVVEPSPNVEKPTTQEKKEAIEKPAIDSSKLPLGLKPCKEFLDESVDPFQLAFQRMGVEPIPFQGKPDGTKSVSFKAKGFDVEFKTEKWGGIQLYKFKNKKSASFVFNSKTKYCSFRFDHSKNLQDHIRFIYYVSFKNAVSPINQSEGQIGYQCLGNIPGDNKEQNINDSPRYDFNGKEIEPAKIYIKEFAPSCKLFFIHPFLPLGKYLAMIDKVRVREQPNVKAKIVTELSKNTELEVVEDIGKIEEIGEDVSPWARVKLNDGREGFIYGALIKQEGLFWE
ncbi:MAG: SH3 domain-containing protein [Leptospiraceae bacterium]|nr:SH3 domain-containing protein [Leptospiraceae bacterium]